MPGWRTVSGACKPRNSHLFARNIGRAAHGAAAVRIVEVGPRDGLQNEKNIIPLEIKLDLIRRLSKTGLRNIEVGAFVSPKWVPQMAQSAQLLAQLALDSASIPPQVSYSILVPNSKGLETALSVLRRPTPSSHDVGAAPLISPLSLQSVLSPSSLREISVFIAATETFSQKNTNCSIAESLDRLKPVISLAKSHGLRVRAYVSVVLGCPYEGPNVSPSKVGELSNTLLGLGVDEISLGDTTGMGTAPRTRTLLQTMEDAGIHRNQLAVHFHDTYGQALVNCAVALEQGIVTFDSSVAGLGGCPYAKGATGNVATEDLVHFLHSVGMRTGVDLEQLAEVGGWISSQLKRENGSKVGTATVNRRRQHPPGTES